MAACSREPRLMAHKRLDNVPVVVNDFDAAIAFFEGLGLEFETGTTVQGTGSIASLASTAMSPSHSHFADPWRLDPAGGSQPALRVACDTH